MSQEITPELAPNYQILLSVINLTRHNNTVTSDHWSSPYFKRNCITMHYVKYAGCFNVQIKKNETDIPISGLKEQNGLLSILKYFRHCRLNSIQVFKSMDPRTPTDTPMMTFVKRVPIADSLHNNCLTCLSVWHVDKLNHFRAHLHCHRLASVTSRL